MLLRALQLLNAAYSICVTVFGTATLIRELHPEKAVLPIFNKRFDKPICFKDVHPANEDSSKYLTLDGSVTFTKLEQPLNDSGIAICNRNIF